MLANLQPRFGSITGSVFSPSPPSSPPATATPPTPEQRKIRMVYVLVPVCSHSSESSPNTLPSPKVSYFLAICYWILYRVVIMLKLLLQSQHSQTPARSRSLTPPRKTSSSLSRHAYLPFIIAGYFLVLRVYHQHFSYVQLIFNLVIVLAALYLFYGIVTTIQHDIHQRAVQYSAGISYPLSNI